MINWFNINLFVLKLNDHVVISLLNDDILWCLDDPLFSNMAVFNMMRIINRQREYIQQKSKIN